MTVRENDPAEHRKLLAAGIVLVVTTALLIALSIAIYTKAFDDVTTVTLKTDRAGLQMVRYGDVRFHGVLVGQVRDIDQTGDQAIITLGLEPSSAKDMPRDLEANIMPTTLFGQKFVELVEIEQGGAVGVEDGTTIPPERVNTTVELGRVLARLFPLLRAVRPADLNTTLSALATALNGRGEDVGRTLEKLDGYLTDLNVHLPTLQEDLRLLASVADTYRLAAPDLVTVLANLTVTSRTITAKQDSLEVVFDDVTGLSGTTTRVLRDNEDALVRATELSVPILRLLDKYSPEYNCLLRGIAAYKPLLAKTFEGGLVKQFIEFPANQRRGYDRRDYPEYKDTRGPRCYGLPNNPWEPWPGVDLANGTNVDSHRGEPSYFPGGQGPGSGAASDPGALGDLLGSVTGQSTSARLDPSHTPSGRQTTTAVLSSRSGQPADLIPALSQLNYAPMVRHPGGARA